MPIFAVTYEYTDDSAGRDQFRPEHRGFLAGLDDPAGKVERLESGPWLPQAEQPDGALLVFRAPDAESVAAALDSDPFHRENFIAHRLIRDWKVTNGPWSS